MEFELPMQGLQRPAQVKNRGVNAHGQRNVDRPPCNVVLFNEH